MPFPSFFVAGNAFHGSFWGKCSHLCGGWECQLQELTIEVSDRPPIPSLIKSSLFAEAWNHQHVTWRWSSSAGEVKLIALLQLLHEAKQSSITSVIVLYNTDDKLAIYNAILESIFPNHEITMEQAYRDCKIINNLNSKERVCSGSQNRMNEFGQSKRLMLVYGLRISRFKHPLLYYLCWSVYFRHITN